MICTCLSGTLRKIDPPILGRLDTSAESRIDVLEQNDASLRRESKQVVQLLVRP